MAATRGEQMLALRRARMAAAPPILRGGFRPFFYGGALWAVVAITLWIASLSFPSFSLPTAFPPVLWHRHEMLFGFVGCIISGYLLTSVANWTGWLPVAGGQLLAIFLLWLTARLAVLCSGFIGWLPAAGLDVGFYLLLAAYLGREVLAAKKRNFSMLAPLLLFTLANAIDHGEAFGVLPGKDVGVRAGIGLVVLFISLVGGKLVPSFTRNWLAKRKIRQGLPGQPTRFDKAAIAATALGFLCWTVFPEAFVSALLLALAALLQGVRLWRWRGWKAATEPIVLVLHIGYLWIPLGLLLLAAAIAVRQPSLSVAIHALTAGGMATMILAVMTRTALSQTGRPLTPGWPTTLVYVLVNLGALLRVGAPLTRLDPVFGLQLAALFWGSAFLLFLVSYRRVFFRSRVDDPDG